jgi:hypothetical protein
MSSLPSDDLPSQSASLPSGDAFCSKDCKSNTADIGGSVSSFPRRTDNPDGGLVCRYALIQAEFNASMETNRISLLTKDKTMEEMARIDDSLNRTGDTMILLHSLQRELSNTLTSEEYDAKCRFHETNGQDAV